MIRRKAVFLFGAAEANRRGLVSGRFGQSDGVWQRLPRRFFGFVEKKRTVNPATDHRWSVAGLGCNHGLLLARYPTYLEYIKSTESVNPALEISLYCW